MRDSDNFLTMATYSEGVRKTLRSVIDFMSAIAALVVLLNLFRISQFGFTFVVTTTLLVVLCVLPAIVLRQDKYLNIRGAMIVTGYVSGNMIAVSTLGLAAAALVSFPFHMALCAALFSRKVTYAFFTVFTLVISMLAYLFQSGVLVSPDESLINWNQNAGNWITMIVSLTITNVLVISLVYNLSRYWKETDVVAENKSQQFETLVDYAPDAIMILDLDQGAFVSVNARAGEVFGMDRSALLGGVSVLDISPERQPSGELSDELIQKYVKMALIGDHPTFEWIHVKGDGSEVPCEISLTRMPPFDRQLIRANVVDISTRLAAQKHQDDLQNQLAAAQRLETVGHLTGGVAHDFNNLLAVILGNLELLQDEPDKERSAMLIQSCVDATLRGANLTRSMLSYARQAPLQPEIVDLNKLVRDTKNWAGRTLPASIEIETSLLAGLWRVEIDPNAAESALLNLILNARDAMPDGGKLTIETANTRIDQSYLDSRNEELAPGRYVLVAVSDTGEGIAKDILEKVFEPFFTTKEAGGGSGLGLPMALGFMRQSGGTAQVYSEVGVGTTFKLYFPVTTAEEEIAQTSEVEEGAAVSKGKQILVAEDEADVLAVLKSMLEAAGYAVSTAKSGDEAKEMFEQNPTFDLLLTDIVMPGQLKGTQLAKELRAMEASLPVIFMSGYAAEATVHGNGLRPEDIRLMKPILRKDLLAAIAQTIDANPRE